MEEDKIALAATIPIPTPRSPVEETKPRSGRSRPIGLYRPRNCRLATGSAAATGRPQGRIGSPSLPEPERRSWQDYIGAGLSEEIVSHPGQLHPRKLAVVWLKGTYATPSPEQLRSELHPDYVLEGSARRAGDQVAITAQLIQVSNQTVASGERYSGDVKDLLRIQNQVASTIASEVLKPRFRLSLPVH